MLTCQRCSGDSLSYHDDMAFSTADMDNDLHTLKSTYLLTFLLTYACRTVRKSRLIVQLYQTKLAFY